MSNGFFLQSAFRNWTASSIVPGLGTTSTLSWIPPFPQKGTQKGISRNFHVIRRAEFKVNRWTHLSNWSS